MDMMEVSEMEEEYIPNLDATQIPILPVSSQTQSVANTVIIIINQLLIIIIYNHRVIPMLMMGSLRRLY